MKKSNNQSRRNFIKAVSAAAIVSSVASKNSFAKEPQNIHVSSHVSSKVDFDAIPRISLTTFPTACKKMAHFSKELNGPDIYIKRDDVMELAHGGNKTRKLEYALADAVRTGAKAVITQGGLQSNHVRQTVSGAAMVGLECHVVLSNPVPEMKKELMGSGNYLMDVIMGAHIYVAEGKRDELVQKVNSDLTAQGKKPYLIPSGASNGVGSIGYMAAAREMISQWREMGINPSHIFTASGSCGTQAGLLMGLRYFGNTTTKVVGISIGGPAAGVKEKVRKVLNEICDVIDVDKAFIKDHEIIVNDDYYGKAYGYPTEAGLAAIKLIGEKEGILLDPVYTSKAMSGLIDMINNGNLEDPNDVVFLHTGGAPALHPYAKYFL